MIKDKIAVPKPTIRKFQSQHTQPKKITNNHFEQELKSSKDINAIPTSKNKPKLQLKKTNSKLEEETKSDNSSVYIKEFKLPKELTKRTETIKDHEEQKITKKKTLPEFLKNWDETAFENKNKETETKDEDKKRKGIRMVQSEQIISKKSKKSSENRYRDKMLHFQCLKKNIKNIAELKKAYKTYYLIDYNESYSVKFLIKQQKL